MHPVDPRSGVEPHSHDKAEPPERVWIDRQLAETPMGGQPNKVTAYFSSTLR